MTLNPRPLSRMFRLPRRHRRPGSVLILVIVLLVLLALIGTAYVSTSRSDRAASQQGLANAQTDQLGDGGASIAQGTILSSLFVNDIYRPSVAGYNHFDATSTSTAANDDWLADRVPLNGGTAAAPVPYWPAITRPLVGLNFESPDGTVYTERLGLQAPANGLKIDAVTVNYGSDSMVYPAFTDVTAKKTFIAGDADGDGIADCGLVRLPGTFIDGLTYYAGFRIIDNNSTVNVNTAMTMMGDYANADTPGENRSGMTPTGPSLPASYGIFPTSVGLDEMLYTTTTAPPVGTPTEAANLANYRLGPTFTPPVVPAFSQSSATPYDDQAPPVASSSAQFATQPFNYVTQGDSLYHQSLRRLDNPGVNYRFSANPLIDAPYQTLPIGDQAALAYHFCLINPSTSAAVSMTESLLAPSVYNAAPNYGSTARAYLPSQFGNWYSQNFSYPVAPDLTKPPTKDQWKFTMPLRALLSVRNPVSNAIPVVNDPNQGAPAAASPTAQPFLGEPINPGMLPYDTKHFKGPWLSAATYNYGDIVTDTYAPPGGGPSYERSYMYVVAGAANARPAAQPSTTQPWAFQPWTSVPQKASINTATFAELWRAFWCVMCGAPATGGDTSPFLVDDQNNYNLANTQVMFRSPIRDPRMATTIPSTQPVPNPPGLQRLTPIQTVQLRAGLAALNAQYMRTAAVAGNNDVISKRITLYSPGAGGSNVPAYDVELFANAPQPFITELYVNTDTTGSDTAAGGKKNNKGYVAIELYNPYPFAINIGGWEMGIIDRRQPPGTSPVVANPFPSMSIQTITGFTGFPAGTVVPAGGFVILENYDGASTGVSPTDANFRPATSGLTPPNGPLTVAGVTDIFVSNLHEVINDSALSKSGGELVLLRPRKASGVPTNSADPTDPYVEGTAAAPNLDEWVPVDSYDFTNLTQGTAAGGADVWHYVRNKALGAWKFVYPGPYDGTVQTSGSPRYTGTDNLHFIPPAPPTVTTAAQWGQTTPATATASYNNPFAPIEICNTGTPGPFASSGGTSFPFGGFARNGDILHVPYIGAYRIRILVSSGGAAPTYLPAGYNSATGTSPVFCELNPLPPDTFFAADSATGPVASAENVGRFCPFYVGLTSYANYDWCRKLFNYVTVQSPSDDYFPNIDPMNAPNGAKPPVPVFNADGTTNTQRQEWNLGVEGLININTAPVPVLARLPLVMDRTGKANGRPDRDACYQMAQAIVADRMANGPFQTIFDLNRVAGFATENGNLPAAIQDYDGDLAAIPPGGLGPSAYPNANGASSSIVGDYRHDFAVLNRISNLITTRSDTFTVYVVVEGWQNVGTTTPRRVTQKHTAFILDRTGVSQLTRTLKTVTVPTD